MMKPYAWSCLACAATHPPAATRCERCACPAQATGAQIVSARQAWQRRDGVAPPVPFDLARELQTVPLLLVGAGALALLGVVTLILSAAAFPSLGALGALLLAFAALCVSSYRPPAA